MPCEVRNGSSAEQQQAKADERQAGEVQRQRAQREERQQQADAADHAGKTEPGLYSSSSSPRLPMLSRM